MKKLTVSVLERLFLFGRLRDDLDALAVKDSDILTVTVKHFDRKHKMLPLIRIGNEKCLGSAIALFLLDK